MNYQNNDRVSRDGKVRLRRFFHRCRAPSRGYLTAVRSFPSDASIAGYRPSHGSSYLEKNTSVGDDRFSVSELRVVVTKRW